MDCLLERLYHVRTYTLAAVDPLNVIERFELGSLRSDTAERAASYVYILCCRFSMNVNLTGNFSG